MEITVRGKTVGDSYPTEKEIKFTEHGDDTVTISLGMGYDENINIDRTELRRVLTALNTSF